MTTYYTETSTTFPSVDFLPLENTEATAGDMQNVFGKLVNRDAYCNSQITTLTSNIVSLKNNDIATADQIRQLNIAGAGYYIDHSIVNGSGWRISGGILQQLLVTSPQYECFIDIPYEYNTTAYISKIEVLTTGAAGQTTLPNGLPFIQVRRCTLSTGELYDYGATVDTSANLTQFRTAHMITQNFSSGARPIVNPNLYRNIVVIRGSHGSGAVAGLEITAVRVTFTPTA